MKKQSIAVFNPQDRHEKAVQEAYHAHGGRFLTAYECKNLTSIILSFRGLGDAFEQSPEEVANDVFEYYENGRIVYLPCDVIELRSLLKEKKLCNARYSAFFSSPILKKYLKDYDVFLGVDKKGFVNSFGAIHICDKDVVDLKVLRAMINENVDYEVLDKTILNMIPESSVHVLVDTPGAIMPKVAEKLKKFVVNIDALGISNEVVKTTTPEKAVEQALFKHWKRQNTPHRDPKYHYTYWKETPFWENIVKEANTNITKVADVGSNTPAYPQLTRQFDKVPGEKNIERKTPQEITNWEAGMRVRGHYGSFLIGVITKIKDNLMFVKWDGIKDEHVIDLTNTVDLARINKL